MTIFNTKIDENKHFKLVNGAIEIGDGAYKKVKQGRSWTWLPWPKKDTVDYSLKNIIDKVGDELRKCQEDGHLVSPTALHNLEKLQEKGVKHNSSKFVKFWVISRKRCSMR